jgi:hypothetical protein
MCKTKNSIFSQFIRRIVGLSDVPDDDDLWIGYDPNSYAILVYDYADYECRLSGEEHHFELPEGGIQPIRKRNRNNVFGCGLVVDPEDKLAIFFTLNGKIMSEFKLLLEIFKIDKKLCKFLIILINFNINHNYIIA